MKDREFASFSPAFHWTDQKLRVHAFYCTLALMIVSLIERQIHHAGIEGDELPLGAKLTMRLLNEINEVTLIYPPAGGHGDRPKARTRLAEMDDTQQELYDALNLAELAPSVRSYATQTPNPLTQASFPTSATANPESHASERVYGRFEEDVC